MTGELKPPTGLQPPGLKLWHAVVDRYELSPAEVEVLGQACLTCDELDRLEHEVRELPRLVTTGSTGQVRPHPLLAEVRAHRQLLERLASALALPVEGEEVGIAVSAQHSRAVQARWRKHRARAPEGG
jgi:hypothetical protein